jgi:hypothetical protein
MSESEIVTTLRPLIRVFDEMNIPYQIGGSVASSVFGKARSTMDIDLVAPITNSHIPQLVGTLGSVYYISDSSVKDAIARNSSFNIIHLETMMKIDIFILKNRSYDQQAFNRRRADVLDTENQSMSFFISSPEDIIINKLEWFKLGGEKSERQWDDVVGVLKVQCGSIDVSYCREWAQTLGLMSLLEKALKESGLN